MTRSLKVATLLSLALWITTARADQGPPPEDDSSSAANSAELQRINSSATRAEKDLLLQARALQPRTVVALSESLATAQAIRRARGYLATWQGNAPTGELPAAKQLATLTKELADLQQRFLTLYHAHYGNEASATLAVRLKIKQTPPLVPVSAEAAQLSQDAAGRAAA